MSGMPAGFLFPLISGIVTGVSGAVDMRRAKKREEALGERPPYEIPEPTMRNQSMAENIGQQGLSDATMTQMTQANDRAMMNSIDALLKAGGGMQSISDVYNKFGENSAEIAVLDDQARFRNQQLFMNQNSIMADELDKKFQLNVLDPWKDEKRAIAELRALGNTKKMAGASMIANSMGGTNAFEPPKKTEPEPQQRQLYRTQQPQNSMDDYRQYYNTGYDNPQNYNSNGWNQQPQGNWILDNIYSENKV